MSFEWLPMRLLARELLVVGSAFDLVEKVQVVGSVS